MGFVLFLPQQQGQRGKLKIPDLELTGSKWSEPITIDLQDCMDLMRFEMAFTRLLQIQQRSDMFDDKYYFNGPDGIHKYIKPTEKKTKNAADVRAKLMAAKRFKFAPPASFEETGDPPPDFPFSQEDE